MRAGGLQTPACHACVTKFPRKTLPQSLCGEKPRKSCHAPVTNAEIFVEIAKRQIMMVKMAVDSGMCIVPTEHCIRMQTLRARI